MPLTYIAIATVTVPSGGAANIQFTSIPQTYTDLLIKMSARTTSSGEWGQMNLQFNGNAANYTSLQAHGTGSAAGVGSSDSWGTSFIPAGRPTGSSASANLFGASDCYISNYTTSNNKSIASFSATENNGTAAFIAALGGTWANSAAITSIKLYDSDSSGNIVEHSTFTLYGIKKD